MNVPIHSGFAQSATLKTHHNHKKSATFDLDGASVPLTICRHRRARRMIVRVDAKTDGIRLTLPWSVAEFEGLDFLRTQKAWLRGRLGRLVPRVAFDDGTEIEILGETHRIRGRPDARRAVWAEAGVIHVSGQPEHLARRLTDWLKAEAKRRLAALSQEKAGRIGKSVKRVTVRDTTSRWGSCSSDGSLNYSWRLIMAPPFVFDFIVAHEVAHLIERNHGPRFHRLVDQLTDDAKRAEAWLQTHGATLHRMG